MASNDVVIGAVDKYSWDKVDIWANSLAQCGFDGKKILITYRVPSDVREKAHALGFEVYNPTTDYFNNAIRYEDQYRDTVVHQLRFFHIWQILKQLDVMPDRVIITDVRDVVFQGNPSEWLDANLKDKFLVAPSEGVLYKDENWNAENMIRGFGPYVWQIVGGELPVCNVGTIAGKGEFIADFCLSLYLTTVGHYIPSDQSAFNLLAHTTLKSLTRFTPSEDGWCCQCATFLEPERQYMRHLLKEPIPVMKDGLVYTYSGIPYVMVHQYDRVPQWESTIRQRLRI